MDGGRLENDAVWDNSEIVYWLSDDVTVAPGVTLQIVPGQIVKIEQYKDLVVDGTLEAVGTDTEPIIFTRGNDHEAGGETVASGGTPKWGSLRFTAVSTDNVLDRVQFRYGASNNKGQVYVDGGPLTIKNCLLSDASYGLRIENGNPTVLNNTFRDHDQAAISMDLASNPTINGTTLQNNWIDGVQLDSGVLADDAAWDDPEIVYRLAGDVTVPAGTTLQIGAGQIIKVASYVSGYSDVDFVVNGTLLAIGTPSEPIIFTQDGDDTAGGDTFPLSTRAGVGRGWQGIIFTTTSGASILDHVQVRYGGQGYRERSDGAIVVLGEREDPVIIHNSLIYKTQRNNGILASDGAQVELANNLIVGKGVSSGPGIRAEDGALVTAINNTIDNGSSHTVEVDSATINLTNNLITGYGNSGVYVTGTSTVNAQYNDIYSSRTNVTAYDGIPDQTGLNGNISEDPRYFSLDNMQFQLRPDSPAIDSATSAGAPATDFYANGRFDDPAAENAGAGTEDFYDRGAIEVQEFPASQIDLAVTRVAVSEFAPDQQTATLQWSVRNLGSATATGPWEDAVYLSIDPVWSPDDTHLGMLERTRDLGPNQTYDASSQLSLPDGIAGRYFFIVRTDVRNEVYEGALLDNNSGASSTTPETAVRPLTLDVARDEAFSAAGQTHYYRLDITEMEELSQTLAFTLDSDALMGANELYIRRGALPTRSAYDARDDRSLDPDHSVSIPDPIYREQLPVTYYVMVHTRYGDASTSPYTLTAGLNGLEVRRDLSPPYGSNGGSVTVTIHGNGFSRQTQAFLSKGEGSEVAATKIYFDDATQIHATFDLTSSSTGGYDLRVADGNAQAIELNVFTVNAVGVGKVDAWIAAPEFIREDGQGEVSVDYANVGQTDMLAPLLVLYTEELAIVQACHVDGDYKLHAHGSWTAPEDRLNYFYACGSGGWEIDDYRVPRYQFLGINQGDGPAGILPPGAAGRFTIQFGAEIRSGWGTLHVAVVNDPDQAIDWSDFKEETRPEYVSADAWEPVWKNFTDSVGETIGSYNAVLAENATYLGQLGKRAHDIAALQAFELVQSGAVEIAGRYRLGAYGRGVPDPWDIVLTSADDGNTITVSYSGLPREFYKLRSGYYSDGSGATLTLASPGTGYAHVLRESDGRSYGFLSNGKLGAIVDRNDNPTTLSYSGGRLRSVNWWTGDRLSFEYNALGRVSRTTDQAGTSVTYTYDAAGEHLLSVTTPGGVTSYTYVPPPPPSGPAPGGGSAPPMIDARSHAISSISTSAGLQVFFEYDDRGRLIKTYAEDEAETLRYSYDSVAGVTVTDAADRTTYLAYDQVGNLGRIEDSLGRVWKYLYDSNDQLIASHGPGGVETSYRYDGRGNLDSSTDALGNTIYMTYEPTFNQLTSIRDARGNLTQYTYDTHGNLLAIIDPAGEALQYAYDVTGKITEATNRRGSTIRYKYDGAHRLSANHYPDGSQVQYGYDARDNLTTVTDASGITLLQYDSVHRLTRITYPTGRFLEYSYDVAGRRSRIVDQDGYAVNYTYNLLGRLDSLSDDGGGLIVSYTDDEAGRLAREDKGNGTYTTYEYDAADHLQHLVHFAPDGSVNSRFDYEYDPLGRVAMVTTLDGVSTYLYDALGQLTQVRTPAGRQIQYQYDAVGNRVSVTDDGVTTDYTTNHLDQYVQVGEFQYEYDADGNLVSKTDGLQSWTYSYDHVNRLLAAASPEHMVTYEYSALGTRTAQTVDGERVEYLLDPTGLGNVVGQYRTDGSLISRYTHGIGLVNKVDSLGTTNFYDLDVAGSVVGLSGLDGQYASMYEYLPFGELHEADDPLDSPFQYVGRWGVMAEPNGLTYMRARYYDAQLGRFLTADPLGYPSENLHAYANNDPVSNIDPFGLRWTGFESFLYEFHVPFRDPMLAFVNTNFAIQSNSLWTLARNAKEFEYSAASFANTANLVLAVPFVLLMHKISLDLASENSSAAWYGHDLANLIGSSANLTTSLVNLGSSHVHKNFPWATKGLLRANVGLRTISPLRAFPTLGVTSLPAVLGLWSAAEFGYALGTFVNYHVLSDDMKDLIGDSLLSMFDFLNAGLESLSDTVVRVISAWDPNDKAGPGSGSDLGFIRVDAVAPYTIRFENDPDEATAPAQEVFITDTLDPNLDWTTFELGTMGFGDLRLTPPLGLQELSLALETTNQDGSPLWVRINAGLDMATGVVTWAFRSIDPATGRLPADPFAGFLPVNDRELHNGEGFVSFLVRPKADLTTGARIENEAEIVFDANEPIVTNIVVNTIDAMIPEDASHVEQLPPTTTQTSFDVHWSGQDDVNGSGIGYWNVYVSIDDGPFEMWRNAITDTSDTWTGEMGHKYAFASVARDYVGHREAMALAPDAVTFLGQNRWHNYLQENDVNGQDGVTPLDVLSIITWINSHPGEASLPTEQLSSPHYYDVNDDNLCTPLDVLMVIGHINSQFAAEIEGEAIADSQYPLLGGLSQQAVVEGGWTNASTYGSGGASYAQGERGDNAVSDPFFAALADRNGHLNKRQVSPSANHEIGSAVEELEDVLSDIAPDIDNLWQTPVPSIF